MTIRKINITVEELVNFGNFTENEAKKIFMEITSVTLRLQKVDTRFLSTTMKTSFFDRFR